jgi:hypothetical protein
MQMVALANKFRLSELPSSLRSAMIAELNANFTCNGLKVHPGLHQRSELPVKHVDTISCSPARSSLVS